MDYWPLPVWVSVAGLELSGGLSDRPLRRCSEYVAIVQRYVETRSAFEAGAVAHALCAAMRDLLTDWQLMVTQLEHQLRIGTLTLQVRALCPDSYHTFKQYVFT